jgi:hypothetical protein
LVDGVKRRSKPSPRLQNFRERFEPSSLCQQQNVHARYDYSGRLSDSKCASEFQGDCGTEMTIVDAWFKSWGIAQRVIRVVEADGWSRVLSS